MKQEMRKKKKKVVGVTRRMKGKMKKEGGGVNVIEGEKLKEALHYVPF